MTGNLPARWVPGPYVFKHFEWREPGDPPGGTLVRHGPLAKPIKYHSLTPEIELELVRRYREDGDLDALDQLVGAHRPMVVHMAKHLPRGDIPLRALVEYGLIGVRIAAEPPRPSRTKKGEMVGFDAGLGHRFSTYARAYARKEMMAALSGEESPALRADEFPKAAVEAENWHTAPSLRGIFPDTPEVIRDLQQRRWQYCLPGGLDTVEPAALGEGPIHAPGSQAAELQTAPDHPPRNS